MLGRYLDYGNPVNQGSALNRGLVSWWMATPQTQGGSRFLDLCGRNHGTLTNGPTWIGARGRPGGWGAIVNDGTDYVQLQKDIPSLATTVGTVMCWFYGSGFDTVNTYPDWDRPVVIGGEIGGDFKRLYLGVIKPTGSGKAWMRIGETTLSSADVVPENVWTHIACQWRKTDGSMRIFLNGKLNSSTTGPTTSGSTGYHTRLFTNKDYAYAAGTFDDVRIYEDFLTDGQIEGIYNDSRTGNPSTLNWRRRYTVFDVGAATSGSYNIFDPGIIMAAV